MARRRSLFKLPFLKVKINKKTVSNILGLLFIASGIIIGVSYLNLFSDGSEGKILSILNNVLILKFGGLSIFIPLIIVLFSAHFFNSKKLKLIKPNVTIGIIFIFIALVGAFQSGEWGQMIFENLSSDFSSFIAILILTVSFIVGLILFLDTSVDVFLLFMIDMVKAVAGFTKTYILRSLFSNKKSELKEIKDDKKKKQELEKSFILDKQKTERSIEKISAQKSPTLVISSNKKETDTDLFIKPITPSMSSTWVYPPLTLLDDPKQKEANRGDITRNADVIEKTLDSFGVRARVGEVNYGPTVTQYALEITMGTKLTKITGLSNDLALALAAPTGQVRIEAPIPGRSLVGIEIPNIRPQIVTLKQMLSSNLFQDDPDPLLVPLGLDVSGKPIAATISKMPHVLIAGTTGSGKSVILNAWISTILFRTKPEDVRLILVDPKRVELTTYNDIPHLLTPVIVEPDAILKALHWTLKEMENRYKIFSSAGARNIESYNLKEGIAKIPYILFVIDELADLMMFAPGDAEDCITRMAQMARATGIHLILATQRPSVDVITGLMKANIPTRLAFNVSSMIDSRVIIDMPGAEKLLGKGDMLYLPPDQAKARRVQGPYVMEKEVVELVNFLKLQAPAVHYTEEITEQKLPTFGSITAGVGGSSNNDALFNEALQLISQFDTASASFLQRKLKVGYARAARILDELEQAGYVGPAEGSKPREVIKRNMQPETPAEEIQI